MTWRYFCLFWMNYLPMTLLNFPQDLPIPLAAYIFLGSIRSTCLNMAIALSWCLFSFILSLDGVWRVCNQTFPNATNAYVSLAVAGCFNIRSNFFCPGPHSCFAKWRFPINVQASGWSYNMSHYSCLFIENPGEIFQKGNSCSEFPLTYFFSMLHFCKRWTLKKHFLVWNVTLQRMGLMHSLLFIAR